jgi:peptidoglycan/LPS O-acetylase OafA/YrhL
VTDDATTRPDDAPATRHDGVPAPTAHADDAVAGAPATRQDDFPALTALRAVGAVAVVATHVAFQTGRSLTGPFAPTLARLDVGVAVFFVLSGFLLGRQWLRGHWRGSPPRLRAYYWRRALRILPAYWLTVAACLLLLPQNRGVTGPLDWVRHALLAQVYGSGWQRHGLTQTWSLCTEVAFYLVLPVVALLVARRGGPTPRRAAGVLLVGTAVTAAWILTLTANGPLDARVAGQWLPAYASWFSAGLALAVLSLWADGARSRRPGRPLWVDELAGAPGTWWLVGLAAFLAATTPLAGPRSLEAVPTTAELLVKNLLYLVVAGCLVAPFVFRPRVPGRLGRVLVSRPAVWLGEISYSIFLWHLLVLELSVRAMGQELFTGSFAVTFAVTLSGTVVLAALCYRLVEVPCLRLRDRVPDPAPAGAAAGSIARTAATATQASAPVSGPKPR